jgi:hypothetical protein
LATPQLGREPSLLRHFGQIGRNSPAKREDFDPKFRSSSPTTPGMQSVSHDKPGLRNWCSKTKSAVNPAPDTVCLQTLVRSTVQAPPPRPGVGGPQHRQFAVKMVGAGASGHNLGDQSIAA